MEEDRRCWGDGERHDRRSSTVVGQARVILSSAVARRRANRCPVHRGWWKGPSSPVFLGLRQRSGNGSIFQSMLPNSDYALPMLPREIAAAQITIHGQAAADTRQQIDAVSAKLLETVGPLLSELLAAQEALRETDPGNHTAVA